MWALLKSLIRKTCSNGVSLTGIWGDVKMSRNNKLSLNDVTS